jgi:hypothetical protein
MLALADRRRRPGPQPRRQRGAQTIDLYGPWLQAQMFAHGGPPPEQDMIAFAERARHAFADLR